MVRKSLRGGGGVQRSPSLELSSTGQPNSSIVRNAADQHNNSSQGTSSQAVPAETAEAMPADIGEDEFPTGTTTDASSQDSEACSTCDISSEDSDSDSDDRKQPVTK